MGKIVILTSRPEPDKALMALLNMVFPDCEIHIVFRKADACDPYVADASSGPSTD
ncbi:MAG: hypothetical protein JRJ42_07760 [Deltaproteobacteria bacterium]|nr:hypothetical protein [Deltaproteobacteria bacterium]MBW2020420.1 hypothetical protein [Deltaproteobacteria bacterium]MBW2075164.1 hypothetical protein [Deltaproteobacteria bacterium]